jgi:hypothetical protein
MFQGGTALNRERDFKKILEKAKASVGLRLLN